MKALLLLVGVALAQQPERPLAIPASPPVAAPAAAPVLTADKLSALRAYQAQRLVVRDEVELVGGGATMVGGWGYPYGRYGYMHPTVVVQEPTEIMRVWGIYRGRERLSTPRFLDLAGQADLHTAVQADIRKARRSGTAWFSVAGVGLAGILGGMVGLELATTEDQARVANRVVLAGTGFATGGLLIGSFPRAKASRLSRYPSITLSADQANELADAHNAELRDDLGLSPAEVWDIELGGDR